MKPPRPTDAELDILHLLWDLGPSTVRQVHERLAASKPSQYTTTLKLMQIMTDKGLLQRDESARSHVYRAALPREHVQQQVAGYLLDRVFGGSARSLMLGALAARRTSPEELDALRRMLKEYDQSQKKGSPR